MGFSVPHFLSTLLAKALVVIVEALVAEIVLMVLKSVRSRMAATAPAAA
ncbi:hypothetical protein [Marinitenerispora sediminis]|nr:hypothetical protein [Marinitenerispora sediminis]